MGFRVNVSKTKLFPLKTRAEVVALAAKLKSYGGTECEREEKETRKKKIKAKVLGGEMRPFNWAVGQCADLIQRMDGMHSSDVFLELNDEEWGRVAFPVLVMWEHHDCDEMIDLAVLFEQYNPPWSSRNSEDLVGAHLAIHEELAGLKDRHVNARVLAGLSWYAQKAQGLPKMSQFQFVHDKDDAHAFLLWCGSFLQKRKTAEMFHPAVIGAMRHAFSPDDADGMEFWKAVSRGRLDNDGGSMSYKLAVFLGDLADPAFDGWDKHIRKHFTARGTRPTEGQVFATCLKAYQAERSGKKLGDIFDPVKGKKIKDVADEYTAALVALKGAA